MFSPSLYQCEFELKSKDSDCNTVSKLKLNFQQPDTQYNGLSNKLEIWSLKQGSTGVQFLTNVLM